MARPRPHREDGPTVAGPVLGDALDEGAVRELSSIKGEPGWMLDRRLRSRRHLEGATPSLAADLARVPLGDLSPSDPSASVDDVGDSDDDEAATLRRRLRILEAQGVVYCDMDTAVREHPELVQAHFGTVVPIGDDPISALNTSVWSGGSFIHVPAGVEVELPLQAHHRAAGRATPRFGRTLVVAGEGSRVRYVEGCSAPVYSTESLHAAVVEVVVKSGAQVTYTTLQNWSANVFNLVTKRARVESEGRMEWIDGDIGSRLTVKQPSVWLVGPKASGEVLSAGYAGRGRRNDTGARVYHAAPETSSRIMARSIARDGGRSRHRAVIRVADGADSCRSEVRSDALLLDEASRSDTHLVVEGGAPAATPSPDVGHTTTVSRMGDRQLFYLMTRGLSEQQATAVVANGFVDPVTRRLPMEYAVEWSRLIELEIGGSVG